MINRDGLRRSIPVTAVDSLQEFVASTSPGKTGTRFGAVLIGGAMGLFYIGLCDYDCVKGTVLAGAIGALVGGAVGRAIGGGIAAAEGEWVTRYRRGE